MNKEKGSLRIRYEYEREPDTEVRYAHGVWGGINPHGEVELNFYTESDKLPSHSERIITPDGGFGHEMAPFDESLKVVVRNVHSRLLFNYHTAKAVIEWLEEKVRALEDDMDRADGFLLEGDPELKQ